jgi:NAD(P)-dependent dehydrogenase (short-subunit alcohol dehydrogenase family)
VLISSLAASMPQPSAVPYGAAKAGVNSVAQCLAVACGPDGVRVNAVAPGPVGGNSTESLALPADADNSPVPMRRKGALTEMANAVLFLLSSLSTYVSGQVLTVDGGVSVRAGIYDQRDLPYYM